MAHSLQFILYPCTLAKDTRTEAEIVDESFARFLVVLVLVVDFSVSNLLDVVITHGRHPRRNRNSHSLHTLGFIGCHSILSNSFVDFVT